MIRSANVLSASFFRKYLRLDPPPADAAGTGAALGARVMRAASWSLFGHFSRQVLRFGGNLVMTRLLVPEAFGLMAIATVLLFGLQLFTDVGLRQNVVQSRQGDDRDFLDTVWTLQILRGALVWGLALGAAALLAGLQAAGWVPAGTVYGEAVLPAIVGVLAANALVAGFESTKVGTASRHLALARITLQDLGTQVFGLLVTLAWAFLERSVWALVAGSLAASAARVALSHLLLPGAPNRLRWDRRHLSEIIGFGKWVFLSSIAGFLLSNADRLLLGGLIAPGTLGLYVVAYLLVNSLQWALLNLITTVYFPVLSAAAREGRTGLAQLYYRLRLPLELASLLLAGLLLAFGAPIVAFFYDGRYEAAGPMLEIIGLSLAALPYQLSDQLYLASGHSRLLFFLNTFRAAAIYLLLPIGHAAAGVDGALWAIALAPFLAVPISLHFNQQLGVMNLRREVVTGLALLGLVTAPPLSPLLPPLLAHWI